MIKIEGSAEFATPGAAQDACAQLAHLRHDDSNAIVGGAHALNDNTTVTVSYRLREGTNRATADKLTKQLSTILDGASLDRTETVLDTEHVYNPGTGRVEPRRANRVVQTLDDGTDRVVVAREKVGDVTDPETGEKIGSVPIRSVTDQDGNKVQFDGPRGAPDPSVTVEKA
jgi:hypothetical protein